MRSSAAAASHAVLPLGKLRESGLVRLLPQANMPEMECFLVATEGVKTVARVQAFRDFLARHERSAGATEERSVATFRPTPGSAATCGPTPLAAQSGDKTLDRRGEVARRSGRQYIRPS